MPFPKYKGGEGQTIVYFKSLRLFFCKLYENLGGGLELCGFFIGGI